MDRLADHRCRQTWCLTLSIVVVVAIGAPAARGGSPPEAECGNDVVEDGEECDGGNTFGGDGCAANCTFETEAPIVLDSALSMPRSGALVQAEDFSLSLTFSGSLTGRIGKAGADGIIPVAVRAGEILFNPIPVPGIACLCSRPLRFDAFGPGNAGVGQIGCGPGGLPGVDVHTEVDHRIGVIGENDFTEGGCMAASGVVEDGSPNHPHAGVCNGPIHTTRAGDGPQGSALITVYTSFDVIRDGGSCRIETDTKVCEGGSNAGRVCTDNADVCGDGACVPAKGNDGIPCTDDDPTAVRGRPQQIVSTTGTARAAVRDANNVLGRSIAEGEDCGTLPCATSARGLLFDCSRIDRGEGAGILVSAFPTLDAPVARDTVNTVFIADVSAPTFTPTFPATATPTATPIPPDTPTVTPTETAVATTTATETETQAATETPTATPSSTDTPTATATHTAMPTPACIGDCDGSGMVTIDELVTGVRIALGEALLSVCDAFDADGSGSVSIDELVRAVTNALDDCEA